MKNRRTYGWIAAVLSGIVLAGLLLMFGLGLIELPGTGHSPTPTPSENAATPTQGTTPTATPTQGTAPTQPVETPTQAATPAQAAATPTQAGVTPANGVINPKLDTAVYCLSVGEGSSTLFCSGTTAVLIDGGDALTSSYVVGFLKSLGIRRLQLVVATHYDSDHISGLVGALSAFVVDEVWGPNYVGTTKTYNSFAEMIRKRRIPWTYVRDGQTWSGDGCTVTVLASAVPEDLREGEEDESYDETGADTSLAIKVTLDKASILVMGDAGAARERALVKQGKIEEYDIFLVNHHGSRYSNTAELLRAAKPEFAIISVGANEYGHPTKECIDRLAESGAKIYRTDLQGTITLAIADGNVLPDKAALTDPYEAAGDGGTQRVEHPDDVAFILNGNSMVYHRPDCKSVAGEMHRNWFYFYGTAEEAEALGYRPCGSCLGGK